MGRPLMHRRHIYTQAVACFPCSRRIHVASWLDHFGASNALDWEETEGELWTSYYEIVTGLSLRVMRATEATNWELDIYHGVGILRSAESLIQSDDITFLQHLFLPKWAKMCDRVCMFAGNSPDHPRSVFPSTFAILPQDSLATQQRLIIFAPPIRCGCDSIIDSTILKATHCLQFYFYCSFFFQWVRLPVA